MRQTLINYSIATIGLACVALGVAISVRANLGTSPITCLPYVCNLRWGSTVGTFTAYMHVGFILLQIALLRRRFKLVHLMQIPAAVLFSIFIDLFIWATAALPMTSYPWRLFWILLGILIMSFGISIEVRARAWMVAGEMTVAAITTALRDTNLPFRTVKVLFDTTLVLISGLLSLLFFGNFLGDGTSQIIREGTILLALLVGYCMRFMDPVVGKIFGKVLR